MTEMPKMTRLDTATHPHDPYQDHSYTCHSGNTRQRRDIPHPKPCKIDPFLDMFLIRFQKDSWAHSGFDHDAIGFTQPRFTIPWPTPIPMFLCIDEPRDARHSRDKTLPWVVPTQLPARTRNQKQRKTKKQKNFSSQSPFLFSQKCLKLSGMSKANLDVAQSANCRLMVPEKFCQNQGDAKCVNGTRISPPLALPADLIAPHIPQTNFLIKAKEQAKTMPAIRRVFTRTYQPPSKPYDQPPTNIFAIQAAILDDIQGITDFTETYEESQMDPSTLLRTIRLLVNCETALETTATGLQIALPGTKYQYYRPVFQDFEDALQRLKTQLLSIANVSDELRQAALNQLNDYIPPPPPGSPPLSPSSPAYSPISWSSSNNEDDESEADDDASTPDNTNEELNIME